MLSTFEVEIDLEGCVRAISGETIPAGRALLTMLRPLLMDFCEPVLAEDWLKPEEDEAWAHLQTIAHER